MPTPRVSSRLSPFVPSTTFPALAIIGARRIRTFSANPGSAVLDDTAGHVTSGALRPTVHSVYPLTDIAAAHQAFEHGGVLGKHVLAVSG